MLDGRRVAGRFREIEVELAARRRRTVLRAALGRLRPEGAEARERRCPSSCGPCCPVPREPPESCGAMQPAKDARCARSCGRRCRDSAAADDPERRRRPARRGSRGVHQARVATRRLRSDLRTFRSLLDPEWDAGSSDRAGVARCRARYGPRPRRPGASACAAEIAGLPDDDAGAAPKLLDRRPHGARRGPGGADVGDARATVPGAAGPGRRRCDPAGPAARRRASCAASELDGRPDGEALGTPGAHRATRWVPPRSTASSTRLGSARSGSATRPKR